MKIAIMQPYCYPYAGYFRLFATTDMFVFLDDVQFNRRGRVHRYETGKVHKTGTALWETLPLAKQSRDETRIIDLAWRWGHSPGRSVCDFIIDSVKDTCEKLKIPYNVTRSSRLHAGHVTEHLKGEKYLKFICHKLKADCYLNAPGGKELYDEESFAKDGIKLEFLPEYKGSYRSMFYRLQEENPEDIRKEIYDNL